MAAGTLAQPTFPATPGDVAALTIQEFTFNLDELDGLPSPSITRVCRTFMDDANRALAWWIRFEALRTWCRNVGVAAQLRADGWLLRDACEVAAAMPLNAHWDFEPAPFGLAVGRVTRRRVRVI